MNHAGCAAIVTAAGASSRMAAGGKKEYRVLNGLPVLVRAVLPFSEDSRFARIVVTVPPRDTETVRRLLAPHLPPTVELVEGGATRQQSVLNALRALREAPPAIVLIHDGARPWLDAELVDRVLESARETGACVPCLEPSEAVKEVDGSKTILRHLDRSRLRCAQTPQGFRYDAILAAHEQAARESVSCSDDTELYDRYVGRVTWIPGMPENRKITWPHDLEGA